MNAYDVKKKNNVNETKYNMIINFLESIKIEEWFDCLEHFSEDHYNELRGLYERMTEKGHTIEAIRIVLGQECQRLIDENSEYQNENK